MIKLKTKELENLTDEKLIQLRERIKYENLSLPKIGNKGFNIRENKKNIARINTQLNYRRYNNENK